MTTYRHLPGPYTAARLDKPYKQFTEQFPEVKLIRAATTQKVEFGVVDTDRVVAPVNLGDWVVRDHHGRIHGVYSDGRFRALFDKAPEPEPSTNSHHAASVDLAEPMHARLICRAPLHSLCHADWACECESWTSGGIDGNRAWHTAHEDGEEVNHWATLNPDHCNLKDWFENDDDPLKGSVEFPLAYEFEPDWVEFYPVTGPATVTGEDAP